jgi:AcrR family transcriptional regulator
MASLNGTPTGNDDGPRTPRGRRTREALIRAAREVFETQGFIDARVADIADAASVAHGTFYTYFDSKEAIFKEVANALVGEMYLASRPGADVAHDPVTRIEAANRLYLRAYARNARMHAILEQVSTFDDYFRELRRDIRKVFIDRAAAGISRLQAEGLADPVLDPATTASALGGMVEHFAHLWLALGEPFEEELAVATLTRLWAQAIGLEMPAPASVTPAGGRRSRAPRRSG